MSAVIGKLRKVASVTVVNMLGGLSFSPEPVSNQKKREYDDAGVFIKR